MPRGDFNLDRVSGLYERRSEVSEFQDKQLTCADCGGTFLWTTRDQEFFREKGFTDPPKRCKACRQMKRQRRESQPPPKAA